MIDLRKNKDSAYAAGIELPIELRQRRNALEDAPAPSLEKGAEIHFTQLELRWCASHKAQTRSQMKGQLGVASYPRTVRSPVSE